MVVTSAGRSAVSAALGLGSNVQVADVLLSSTQQTVGTGTTSISGVVATLPAAGSVRPAGGSNALRVVIKDESAANYDVRTIAVRLNGGAFLMVYSQSGVIVSKGAGSSLHLVIDQTVDGAIAATVTFGATDYSLPAASESAPGLVEMATLAEAQAGTDTVRAVSPAGMTQRLQNLENPSALAFAAAQAIVCKVRLPDVAYDAAGTMTWRASGQELEQLVSGGYFYAPIDGLPDGATITGVYVAWRPRTPRTGTNRPGIQLYSGANGAQTLSPVGSMVYSSPTNVAHQTTQSLPSDFGAVTVGAGSRYAVAIKGGEATSPWVLVSAIWVTASVTHPLKG